MKNLILKTTSLFAAIVVVALSSLSANEITGDCDGWKVFSDSLNANCQGGVTYIYTKTTISILNDEGVFESYIETAGCTLVEENESEYCILGTWGEDLPDGTYQVSTMTSFYSTANGIPEDYLRDLAANCEDPATTPLPDGSLPNRCASSTPISPESFECDSPSGGIEGCTPGYWKQPHHFGNWANPYTPDTLFSDIFEDAFPGMTLLEVLSQKGNKTGMEALGRHTVAALLNAASDDVDYLISVDDVISSFNDLHPSTSKDAKIALKEDFQHLNELGCPLARNEG